MHPLATKPLFPARSRPINVPLPPAWRRGSEAAGTQLVAGHRDAALARLEAVLWLADEPLSPRKLATLAELVDTADARRQIQRLREALDADGSAFQIEELAGGYQLLTRPIYFPWLVRLRRTGGEAALAPMLLETLAAIAYRQPIMRADLEAIRGVHCGDALRLLMEKKLVTVVGRHDSLGRPVLYGTTRKFLQTFGLRDLSDLPALSLG